MIDYEREQQDLIYGLIGNYNGYVGRHLVSTFMLSKTHTLRFGSAFTESQFHASSSTLLHYLRQNYPEIEHNIRSTTLSLIETLLSQDPNCNNWNDTDLHLSNFEEIKAQLADQFSNLPPESKIYAQIGIPTHASYLKHPGECSLKELVTNRCYSADSLKQQNRSDKAEKLNKSFKSVTKIIGFDNYIDFLAQWVDQYKDYSIDESALLQAFCRKQEIVQSILCKESETREILNYHLF